MNFLNPNSSAIQAVSTFVLVLITGYYAWQTKRNIDVVRELEEKRNRPRLSMFLQQRDDWLNWVNLIITNYGNDLARNIKFKINEDIKLWRNDRTLSQLDIIKNG